MESAVHMPDTALLIAMYRQMIRIRLVEERIAERYAEDRMKCPVHLSIGQEAAAVGMCGALRRQDVIFSTHRCHAHYLAKGGDMPRMIAEMYGKETGCAHGRGGSMHLIDVDAGVYGTSAIVCGSMPLAVGAAFRFQRQSVRHVSVAFFGDAGVEPGVFHECMNFAAFHKLPVIFFCENNDYSTMTRRRERQSVPIAERAVAYGIPGIRVDGNDLLKVRFVAREAVDRAYREGPTLIEAETYRYREHVEHNTGIMKRPDDEMRFWKGRDPVSRFRAELLTYGIPSSRLDDVDDSARGEVDNAFRFAEESPSPSVSELTRGVGDEIELFGEPPRPDDGRTLTYAEAVAEATVQAMEHDPNVSVFGLHVTDTNGVFGTTAPAFRKFGPERVIETPIIEASMTGIAGGAAMFGLRPLHVHARNDFLLLAMSQLGNEISKWRYMSGGRISVPLVIRAIIGRSRGQGAQHSQSLQSVFAHFPGLHVVAPSNAFDAKGMLMTAALRGNAPVVFLEHRLCHPAACPVPETLYRIPFGKARITRPGTDVTVVTLLQTVYDGLRAAAMLRELGIDAEIIDLRSIRPWDKEAVCASLRKTGRLIIADTGWVDFGISAEIAATVVEREFSSLKAPPVRIGLPPCPTPMAEPLENAYYPGASDIVRAACEMLGVRPPEATEEPSGCIDGAF